MGTLPTCVLFQDCLHNGSGCVPLGHVAENYKLKDYIFDLSRDESALCELYSLPWEVPPKYPGMFLPGCSLFGMGHTSGRGGGELRKLNMPGECERNFIKPEIAVLLSKYTCCGEVPSGG